MLRLRQICLVASELEKPVDDLKAVFGLATCHHDPAVEKYGLTNALLPVGTNFLEVVAPFRDGTAAGGPVYIFDMFLECSGYFF